MSLGMWMPMLRTNTSSDFDSSKLALDIEINRQDLPKRAAMEQYFNHSPRTLASTFFGTPMMLVKPFDHFADDDIKATQLNHSQKKV